MLISSRISLVGKRRSRGKRRNGDLFPSTCTTHHLFKRSFLFCQYPILISLGGKLQIMEADAKRQMADRFKEAFIRTALQGVATDPFLSIRVRRSNLVKKKRRSRYGESFSGPSSSSSFYPILSHSTFSHPTSIDSSNITNFYFFRFKTPSINSLLAIEN